MRPLSPYRSFLLRPSIHNVKQVRRGVQCIVCGYEIDLRIRACVFTREHDDVDPKSGPRQPNIFCETAFAEQMMDGWMHDANLDNEQKFKSIGSCFYPSHFGTCIRGAKTNNKNDDKKPQENEVITTISANQQRHRRFHRRHRSCVIAIVAI